MIRSLASTDVTAVDRLLRATGNFNEAELDLARELMDAVLGDLQQTNYYAFVAEVPEADGLNLVGFLVVGPTPATAGTWDLYWIAVAPASYGTGVARMLEAHAEALVRSHAGYWLLSQTSGRPSYMRSRAFYRKQGYQSLARVADYYAPGDDLVLFGKRLEPRSPS